MAEKFGGKLVFGVGVLATSVLTLILPFCTQGALGNDNSLSCSCVDDTDWCFNKGNFTNDDNTCKYIEGQYGECNVKSYLWVLIILRFLMGLFESVTFPALYGLLNYWTVPSERSKMIGISFAGCYIGNVLGFPLSSFIIASNNDIIGGWPNVFYFFSLMGITWWIVWCFLVSDSPFIDRFISPKELIYLKSQLPNSLIKKYLKQNHYHNDEFDESIEPKINVNWRGFLSHRAALILYLTHFSYNWSFYTLLVELPKYLSEELHYDLSSAGFISVVPYLGQFVISILGGIFIDFLIVKNILSRINARKTAQSIGTLIPGLLLIICGYINKSMYVVILLSIATALMGFVNSGFAATYSDVSPTLSSVMYGIGNTIGTFPGVISPILSGWILTGSNKSTEWKIIFYIAFIVFVIGTSSFWIWGTAEKIPILNRKETLNVVNVDQSITSIDIKGDSNFDISSQAKKIESSVSK